jgi:hypothetical protein
MHFQTYIKKFCFIIISILLLTSCGLVGGGDKADTTENSVLSGPPLSIPPEFDIDSQNANQQQPMQTYDLETLDGSDDISNFENEPVFESTQDDNIFTGEIPSMTNVESTGEIQSFENFNPNLEQTFRQTNVNVRSNIQKKYRSTVPSDAYIQNISPKFGRVNQKAYAQKKKNNFTGFSASNFGQIEFRRSADLSKEEEFLLEDIINKENTPGTIDQSIPDFE